MKKPSNPVVGTAYKKYNDNDIVYLICDDGSDQPWFSYEKNHKFGGHDPYDCFRCICPPWSDLEPLDYPPLKEAKYKIRVNQEQSRQIQEICFKAGIGWIADGRTYHCEDNCDNRHGSLLFITRGEIATCSTDDFFDEHTNQEISAQDFIRIYGAKREFKIGDKVKVVKTREQKDTPLIGETGEITDITTSENVIDVRFYKKHGLDTSDRVDDYTYMLYKSDLELITPVEEKEPEMEYRSIPIHVRDTCPPDTMYFLNPADFLIKPNTTGKQPKKGTFMSKLKNIPELLLAGLDPAKRNYYRLGWIATDSELKLYVTGDGDEAFMACQFLHSGDLPAYAASEVKRIEKEEKAAKKARRESEED